MNKGALFTMEAFLASTLVLLTIFFLYSEPPEMVETEQREIKHRLEDCLLELELNGMLNPPNSTLARDRLDGCLPDPIKSNLTFCENGCEDIETNGKDVISSRRFTLEEDGNPGEIIVYGWVK